MVDSWRENAIELTEKRVQQNRDDLNNEMAGRDTSRIKKFTSPKHIEQESTEEEAYNYLLTVLSQILTEEQLEQFKHLQRQFELNKQAFTLALADIEEELIQAQQELQLIQDNATRLADGRPVYIDENNGHFYDENDQRISSGDEITAQQRHHIDDPTRQSRNSAILRIDNLHQEHEETIEARQKEEELQIRLEENPQDAADIETELYELPPVSSRVQEHRNRLSDNNPKNTIKEVHASAAKEFTLEGIDAELSLLPAFTHAGSVEQDSNDPVQSPEYPNVPPLPPKPFER